MARMLNEMKVFYSIGVHDAHFIRADYVRQYAPLWILGNRARTWRQFLDGVPEEYRKRLADFECELERLDEEFDFCDLMARSDATFPPGCPDGLAREWMPEEVIQRFGVPGYDRDISFKREDADAILEVLRNHGYECIEAPLLIGMMRFGRVGSQKLAEVEALVEATLQETEG